MKLANFVTKLQDVFRPDEEETVIHAVRKGKRLLIPAEDVDRLQQYQRKRVVQVTYTGSHPKIRYLKLVPPSHL